MRDFMQIINEHVDVDREWIINKMVSAIMNGEYWDSQVLRPNSKGDLQHWEMGSDDAHDMARDWAAELRMDDMNPEEIVETQPFQERLRLWASTRYDNVIDKIAHLAKGDMIPAHRFMKVTEYWFDQNREQGLGRLGIFWTFDLNNTEDLGPIWGHELPGDEILIHAMIPKSSVDWHYTILANMDWMQGDREHELRVKAGAPIQVEWIQTVEDGTRVDISGVKYTA